MSRQAELVDLALEQGYVSIPDLAQHFGVTQSTIRRDLADLESRDLVQRNRGGAFAVRQTDAPTEIKQSLHRAEKRAIAIEMAHRILDHQVVLLDSGSTTLEVAKHLNGRELTVVTNDLLIGTTIAQKKNAHLVFIGGELLPSVYTMWGPTSVYQLQNLRVDVAVFGVDTISEAGIFNYSSYEVELKQTMRSIATEAFFVADSSKFGREALFKVFDLQEFTAGITDELLTPIRAAQFPVPLIRASVSDRSQRAQRGNGVPRT